MEKGTFIIKGQGVYVFTSSSNANTNTRAVTLELCNKIENDSLLVTFSEKSVLVTRKSSGEKYEDPSNNTGLVDLPGAYYWFSLDAQNQIFYAGVGEARIETVIYKYAFSFKHDEEGEKERKSNKTFLENIETVVSDETNTIQLLKDPITHKIPLYVLDKDELTMDIAAQKIVMPSSNLSLTSQKIYNCVAGKKFILDDADFPYFSQAIENSIRTPGLWCHEKLKKKATEFNKDKPDVNETYLRITLGQNNGESPGIPYVMEIWPPNHYSPIHSHAGAEAVIRVLHGQINVSLYPFLCGEKDDNGGVKPFGSANFSEGDITWISPTLNQTHKLHNIHNLQTCITIQCYMYDEDNLKHYDYFDYIDASGGIQQYEPDSDMDFVDFKELMKKEWREINEPLCANTLSLSLNDSPRQKTQQPNTQEYSELFHFNNNSCCILS